MRVFSAAKFLPMFLFTSETFAARLDLVPVLGQNRVLLQSSEIGTACLGFSVCVLLSVFLCLS